MSTDSLAFNDFDDILGGDPPPLDRALTVTVFGDELAKTKTERTASLREFQVQAHREQAASKAKLPWLKLARFGDIPTTKGSLRNNGNVLTIDGVEGDYDGETISITEAAARLKAAGVAALLYSSPSHTPEKPRWRVLCPVSKATAASERERLCARLNSALGGVLSGESFTLSQSYYFGSIRGAAAPETALVDGRALDLASELDATAIGRDGLPYTPTAASAPPAEEDDDDWEYQAAPDWERIDSALSAIPVKDADQEDTGGRYLWVRLGMALHQVSGGGAEAFERWDAWSKGGSKYKGRRDQERQWKSLGRTGGKRVRIGTLYEIAKGYGWRSSAAPVSVDEIDQIGLGSAAKALTPPTMLRFLAPSDCASAPSRGYVVKGLVAPGDLGCIFGAPGAGKSLIAPHIGYMAALGRSAFGLRTKPGRVFYVAAEDPHGMKGRITALRLRQGEAPDFVLVEGVSDLLVPDSPDLAALRAAVKDQRPALVFLDTLAMSFPGLEENTAEDMGRVVAIGRSLAAHGAAVILIHHDTKAQGATPRGHSLLNGALDVALHVFPRDESGVVRAYLTKNRNGTADRDIAFRIDTETLGEDEDGDAVTAALVCELPPGEVPKREKLTKSERGALRIFEGLASAGAVTEDALRLACVDSATVSAAENRDSRRKATDRAFKGLAQKGMLLIEGGMVRRPDSVGNAFDEDDGDWSDTAGT